jgi:single-strand DNA-binding protein
MARSTGATARRSSAAPGGPTGVDVAAVNEVRLRGRLAAASTEIPLPSGDVAATFRVIVERVPDRRRRAGGAKVDSIECKAYTADLRRRVARFSPGDILEIGGSLQRRFFRAGGAAVSRYDVVATTVARVARADEVHRDTMAG